MLSLKKKTYNFHLFKLYILWSTRNQIIDDLIEFEIKKNKKFKEVYIFRDFLKKKIINNFSTFFFA